MAIWHLYPYTNLHDVNLDWILDVVKSLKEEIDNLDLDTWEERLEQAERTLTEHASDIESLQGECDSLYEAITGLRTTVESHTTDIGVINGAIDDLDRVVNGLVNEQHSQGIEIDEIGQGLEVVAQSVSDLEPKVELLMEQAFGDLVVSTNNFYFGGDFRDLSKVDYEIVNDVSGGSNPSIYIASGGGVRDHEEYPTRSLITFKNSGDQCHLIIKDFMLGNYAIATSNFNPVLYFGALIWRYNFQANDYYHNDTGISLATLITGFVDTGNGNHKGLFKDMQLVLNNKGNYDLYIYNGRNGYVANGTHFIEYFCVSTQSLSTVGKFMDKMFPYQWNTDKNINSKITSNTPTISRNTIISDLETPNSTIRYDVENISTNEYKKNNNYTSSNAIVPATGTTVNAQEFTLSPQMYPFPDWSVGDTKYQANANFDVTISSLANKTYQQIGTVVNKPPFNIPITLAPVDANLSLRLYGLIRPTGEVLIYGDSSTGNDFTDFRIRGTFSFTYTP